MLAALGQVAHFAVGLGSSPLTVIGLVPIFAAGLAFMRYLSIDPESHPTSVRYVSQLCHCVFASTKPFSNTVAICLGDDASNERLS